MRPLRIDARDNQKQSTIFFGLTYVTYCCPLQEAMHLILSKTPACVADGIKRDIVKEAKDHQKHLFIPFVSRHSKIVTILWKRQKPQVEESEQCY